MTGATQTQSNQGATTAISTVLNAFDTATRDFDPHAIINTIRSGGKNIRERVEAIRKTFRSELDKHGDIKAAKGAIDSAKKQLPAVLWSGTFTERASDKLKKHSGLICADLDKLGDRLKEVREKLTCSASAWAVFISPSGDGLKVVFRVPADKSKHSGSFRAVEQYVKEMVGVEVDQSCKDVARACFLSYDPQVFHNPGAIEIEPLPEPEKRQYATGANIDLSARQRVINDILGAVHWESDTSGFTTCPGKDRHTTGDGDRDCKIDLDRAPTLHCFHNSCRGILDGVNREIRSRIGKAEYQGEQITKHVEGSKADQKTAAQPAKHNFTLVSAKDVLNAEDVEQSWLWDGILPDGGMGLLVAKPKVGKTTLAFNLAVAASRGHDFLGRKTQQGGVVYLALEEKKGEIKKKLKAAGIIDEPLRFHFGSAPINAMTEVEPLLVETKAKLLVIDVLQKFCRLRDLNDYAIVTNALEPLMAAARKQACHILLTHHAGKADRPDGDDILGSTGLLGGVDTSIHIKKRDKRRTFFTIQRYGDDIEETVIDLREDGTLEAKGSRQEVEIEEVKPLISALLKTETLAKTEIYERIEKGKTIVSKAVDLLVEKGELTRTGSGKRNDAYKYSALLPSDTNEGNRAETKMACNPADSEGLFCPSDFHDLDHDPKMSGAAFSAPEIGQKNGQKSDVDIDDDSANPANEWDRIKSEHAAKKGPPQ